MSKGRLEAFSDGVIAILITIMVLELHVPEGSSWHALREVLPTVWFYVLSFIYLGIYWNNHHHLFQATQHISGMVLWANLHLLFWLSLIPFATSWMGDEHYQPVPTAFYGVVLLFCAIAYTLLVWTLRHHTHGESLLDQALGRDLKGKVSLAAYVIAIPAAFLHPAIAAALFIAVADIWFIPDRRIESRVHVHEEGVEL
jgi:uncharacterized membrane protein